MASDCCAPKPAAGVTTPTDLILGYHPGSVTKKLVVSGCLIGSVRDRRKSEKKDLSSRSRL